MANWFYYHSDGSKSDAITTMELKALASLGSITQDTIVETREGKRVRAGKIKNLFPEETNNALDTVMSPNIDTDVAIPPIRRSKSNPKKNIKDVFYEESPRFDMFDFGFEHISITKSIRTFAIVIYALFFLLAGVGTIGISIMQSEAGLEYGLSYFIIATISSFFTLIILRLICEWLIYVVDSLAETKAMIKKIKERYEDDF